MDKKSNNNVYIAARSIFTFCLIFVLVYAVVVNPLPVEIRRGVMLLIGFSNMFFFPVLLLSVAKRRLLLSWKYPEIYFGACLGLIMVVIITGKFIFQAIFGAALGGIFLICNICFIYLDTLIVDWKLRRKSK